MPTRSSTLSSLNSTITSSLNSTTPADYYTVFEEVSKINVHLNIAERLWAAWYLWWQNDTLATGIMSFLMHEIVYFGRCLPYMIIDTIPAFNKYKIQNVSTVSACARAHTQACRPFFSRYLGEKCGLMRN